MTLAIWNTKLADFDGLDAIGEVIVRSFPQASKEEHRAAAMAVWDLAKRLAEEERPYRPPPTHTYRPNKKYPWFCADCGYPEHERLQHTQPEDVPA